MITFYQFLFAVFASFIYCAFMTHEWTVWHLAAAIVLLMGFNYCDAAIMHAG